jgi:nucleotide-binding universal stress UspA family protein
MTALRTIVAATDLSTPAAHAAERAAVLARAAGAGLHLVHVAAPAPLARLRQFVADVPAQAEQRMLDAAGDEVRRLAAHLQARHGVVADAQVLEGPVLDVLPRRADALQADLLVLGAHGASLVRHLLLGSTAERMVSRTNRPLLVVRRNAVEVYRRLLVPVDFSSSSLPAVRLAWRIAPQAELVLLHSFEVAHAGKLRYAGVADAVMARYAAAARGDAHARMTALCVDAGIPAASVRQIVREGDPSRDIIVQQQDLDCDLVVMGKHGQNFVEELLLGSVTQHVLGEATCDVLVSTATA